MVGSEISKFLKTGFVYGVGNILNKFLAFLLLPLYTRYLRPEDYGIMAMLGTFTLILSGFFTLGTGSSAGIVYFSIQDPKERSTVIWTNFFLTGTNSALWMLLLSFTSHYASQLLFQRSDLGYYVVLSLASLSLGNMASALNAYFRMEQKAKVFAALSAASTLISLSLNILFVVYLKRGVQGLLESSLISQFASLLIWLIATTANIKPSFKAKFIVQLIKIGFPSIFGLLAFFFIDYCDRYFLLRFLGLSELGIYNVGYSLGLAVAVIVDGAFGYAWPPFFIKFIQKKEEAAVLFGKVFKYYTFVTGIIGLLFFISAETITLLMTASEYHSAWTVIGIIALSNILKGAYLIFLPAIYFEKKLWVQSVIEWTGAAINVAGNFLLIPILNKEGAALSTLCSYFCLCILAYLFGRKFLKVNYEWNKIFAFLIPLSILCSLTFIDYSAHWLKLAVNLTLLSVFLFYIYFKLLTADERILGILMKKKQYNEDKT